MVGECSTASEPKPGGQSSTEQEKNQEGDQTETRHSQIDHESQQQEGQQEGEQTPPPPQLPPRPLPPPHQEALKSRLLPPQHPPAHAAHLVPLPVPLHDLQRIDDSDPDFDRPYYPVWHKTKLVLFGLSLAVSAVIFGVGIALSFHTAPYEEDYRFVPVNIEFGTSAAAAGLAIVLTAVEVLTLCLSTRRQGMHPGFLVSFHLFVWLLALIAVIALALYVSDDDGSAWYDYPRGESIQLSLQTSVYEQVLLGFDCTLLFIHLVLFVGACVETNRINAAKRKTVYIRVPVLPVGAPYPGAPYPGYGLPPSFVPRPGTQAPQYPTPMISQVPQQSGQGGGPAAPESTVLYNGYYAPAPPMPLWTVPQQQQTNPIPLQEYYGPASVPATGNPAQRPRQPSDTAAAST